MTWNEVTILVDRAKTGDREAYGTLVERFHSAVYAMALARVHDPLEAQELAQEVFIHAMRKLSQLRDARCFAGWLRRMTARMAINRKSRRGATGGDSDVLDNVAGACSEPLDELERLEAAAQLHAGLRQLKPLDRATLEAFYLRGRSLVQIAEEFDTPVGTVKRRLHVARQRLKAILESDGDARPARKVRRKRELTTV